MPPRHQSLQGLGLTQNCPMLLCRAISRAGLQRPDQGCLPWSPPWSCYGRKIEVIREDGKNQKCFLWRTSGWWRVTLEAGSHPAGGIWRSGCWRDGLAPQQGCCPAGLKRTWQGPFDSGGYFLSLLMAEPFLLEPRGGAGVFNESLFQPPWKYSCDLLSPRPPAPDDAQGDCAYEL